jgi:hypothetical protein
MPLSLCSVDILLSVHQSSSPVAFCCFAFRNKGLLIQDAVYVVIPFKFLPLPLCFTYRTVAREANLSYLK